MRSPPGAAIRRDRRRRGRSARSGGTAGSAPTVRLPPITPASSATARTSPFGATAVDDQAHRLRPTARRTPRRRRGGRWPAWRSTSTMRGPAASIDVGQAAALGARGGPVAVHAGHDAAAARATRLRPTVAVEPPELDRVAGAVGLDRLRHDRERVRRGEGRQHVAPLPRRPVASRTRTRPCVVARRRAVRVALRGDAQERPPAGRSSDARRGARPGRPAGAGRGGPASARIAGPDEQLERDEARDRVARAARTAARGRRPVASPCRTRTACRAGRRRATGRSAPTASNASLTTSYGPTETPPATTIASAPRRAPRGAARLDVLELVRRRSRGRSPRRPAARRAPAGPGPFASGMPAGPSASPAGRTSSPVARTATRGRRRTADRATPGARGERDRRRRQRGAGGENRRSLDEVAAAAADRIRPARPPRGPGSPPAAARPHRARAAPRVPGRVERRRQLDRDDRVGARAGSARRSRSGSRSRARPRRPATPPAGTSPTTAEPDRRVLAGAGRRRRRGSRSRPSPSCPTAAA